MSLRKLWLIPPIVILVVLAGLWLARARLAAELAQSYFRQNHIASSIRFDRLGLAGLSGRIALGPADAPDFSADALEVDFDPLSLMPRITQVRLVHPVVRASVSEDGKIHLPTLQAWLDQLSGGSGHSRYVSDDLAISFSGLRALLMTPGGALELNGDAKVQKNSLVSAVITARPAALSWRGYALHLAAAKLTLNAIKEGYAVDAALQGTFDGQGIHFDAADIRLSAPLVSWTNNQLTIPDLVLRLDAAAISDRIAALHPSIALEARNIQFAPGGESKAALQFHAGADFTPPALTQQFPLLARDPRLAAALSGNLKHLDVRLDGDVAQTKTGISFSLQQPLDINGAKGGHLRLASLALNGPLDALSGNLDAALSGPGLPAVTLRSRHFQIGQEGFSGDIALAADFTYDMLRQARIQANGTASYVEGAFNFALTGCAPTSLASFRPGGSDMADAIKGALCPKGAQTFTLDDKGWRFSAMARDAAMTVPLANVALSGTEGVLAFSGKGAAMTGRITIAAAHVADHAATPRFEPLTGSGDITLADWIWQGRIAVANDAKTPLGSASFRHVMASGQGSMAISAPHLEFATGKLQPRMLSSLLGVLTHAEGVAKFDGAVNWSASGFDSHGTLQLQQLDFLTPLGTAHAFNATIVLSSLLPPVTAPGQHIAIGKIDWTLPFSSVAVDFAFGNGKLSLERASTSFLEGNLSLGAIALDFSKSLSINSEADLKSISLAPLVAASNLGEKIKLEGKVTGSLPFSYGVDGIHITNGHLKADGPGRIALDPSIWTQGGAQPVNAVQDLAYQAMENLAFDELSADINSVANGRLQIVLHVKGRNDPPKPQQAEIAIADIINGTALQKKIDLPSGTPVDLTLDTSLNFDQLLQSYAEAWSKALHSSN